MGAGGGLSSLEVIGEKGIEEQLIGTQINLNTRGAANQQ